MISFVKTPIRSDKDIPIHIMSLSYALLYAAVQLLKRKVTSLRVRYCEGMMIYEYVWHLPINLEITLSENSQVVVSSITLLGEGDYAELYSFFRRSQSFDVSLLLGLLYLLSQTPFTASAYFLSSCAKCAQCPLPSNNSSLTSHPSILASSA